MKKKISKIIKVAVSIIIVVIIIIVIDNDMVMNECLELTVPKITKRERKELKDDDIFTNEKAVKIYLSKRQAENMRKKIEQNKNWKSTKVDEKLKVEIEGYSWKEVNFKIPEIENYYWIFTNRTHGIENKHSVDELLEDGYYAISFGMFDIDNNILYYYEHDR